MSILSYKDLFDFDEYEARLNKLAATHNAFAQSVARGLAPINEAYAASIAELGKLQKANERINVSANGAKEALAAVSKATDEHASKARAQKEVIDLLNGSIKVNEQSVKDLKDGLKKLRTDYEALNPTAADFADKQKQVKAAVQAATDQINAQLSAVKAAKKSVDAATGSYAHLSRQTNDLRASLRQMDGAFDLATGKINKHNKEAVEMQRQIQKNDAALKKMDAGMGNYQRNVGNYGSAFKGVAGNMLLAGGAALGISSAFDAISESIKVIDRMERLNNSLKAISATTDEFNKRQGFVRGLANQTGTEIEALTRSYIQFTAATRDTSLEGSKGDKVFAAFSKSFSALGASSATAERGLNAIQQMVSKGKVSAEELRQQLSEALPGSFKLFADAMGVSTAELDKMLKKGEVLASDVLPKVAEKLEKLYGPNAQKNLTTIGGSWANLTNQFKFFLDAMNEEGVISKFFAKLNNGFAGVISRLTAIQTSYGAVEKRMQTIQAARGPLESFWKAGIIGKTQDKYDAAQQIGAENKDIESKTAAFSGLKSYRERIAVINDEKKALKDLYAEKKKHEDVGEGIIYQSIEYKRKTVEVNAAVEKQTRLVREMAKQMKIAAPEKIIKDPVSVAADASGADSKRVLTQYEKLLETIGKLRDTLVDETLADVKAGRALSLPEATLKKWNELYAILEKTAELTGTTIPSNVRELNEKLNPTLPDFAKTIKITQGSTGIAQDGKPGKVDLGKDLEKENDKMYARQLKQDAEKKILQETLTTGKLRKINSDYKADLLAIQDEIHKAERDGDSAALESAKYKHDETMRLAREELAVRKEIAEQSIQVGGQAVEALFEIRSAFRAQEMEANQKAMENELTIAGDNLSAQSKIRADFAQKDLELRRQQAKADKAQALFSIAINTATAITKLLATPPLAILAGVAGAIQAATVLAKPLPAFWTGTDNAPQGLATVAERGPELRESKGKMYLYTKPQVAYLERGDTIYDAADTRALVNQAMRQEEVNNIIQRQTTGRATVQNVRAGQIEQLRTSQPPIDYNRMSDAFVRAIESRPVLETIIDDQGQRTRHRAQNGTITYHNNRYSLGK